MLRESTLLFIGAFFLLFIGLSDYGYGCHKPGNDKKGCDETNHATPVQVIFDDNPDIPDSIQSDGKEPYINEEGVGAIIADEGHPPGGFAMNIQNRGGRNLFINFGDIPDTCADCVTDARGQDVECPFPSDVRATQDGLDETVCSAFVKANLFERSAFDNNTADVRIQNMEPGDLCDQIPDPPPDRFCGSPVLSVRPAEGLWDISFRVPKPKGKQLAGWGIYFADEGGICPELTDFLSIRALDTDPTKGIAPGADTWNIGTFNADGFNEPRLGCLVKEKGSEVVGYFDLEFMYTIEIK